VGAEPEALYNRPVQQEDIERIARKALRDLGVSDAAVTIAPHEAVPDAWRIAVSAPSGPIEMTVRCGRGSTAQWVREQIFNQFQSK
jgi:hypothetical protein